MLCLSVSATLTTMVYARCTSVSDTRNPRAAVDVDVIVPDHSLLQGILDWNCPTLAGMRDSFVAGLMYACH